VGPPGRPLVEPGGSVVPGEVPCLRVAHPAIPGPALSDGLASSSSFAGRSSAAPLQPHRTPRRFFVGAQHAVPGADAWRVFVIRQAFVQPRTMWSAAACRRCLPSRLAGTCSSHLHTPTNQARHPRLPRPAVLNLSRIPMAAFSLQARQASPAKQRRQAAALHSSPGGPIRQARLTVDLGAPLLRPWAPAPTQFRGSDL
jgi:hypothetical protein